MMILRNDSLFISLVFIWVIEFGIGLDPNIFFLVQGIVA